jgi:hypothetical protein
MTTYTEYTYEIERDTQPSNPRELEKIGTIVADCGYLNSDDDAPSFFWQNFEDLEDAERYMIVKHDAAVILPIFLTTRHGYCELSIADGGYRFSSTSGFIYVTREKIKKLFGKDFLTYEEEKEVKKKLLKELTDYESYLNDDVYQYVIKKDKSIIDIQSGFCSYGECREAAEKALEELAK